jgi:hypothetical protein
MNKVKLLTVAILALSTLSAFSSSIIVNWGPSTNIVTSNQLFPTRPNTYDPATEINPLIGASYYPDATGANPVFGGAMSVFNAAVASIENSSSNDRIAFQTGVNNGVTFSAMVMWNASNFLTDPIPMTLQTVTIGGVRQRSSTVAQDSQEIRLILRQGDDYFISADQSFNTTASEKVFNLDGSVNWFSFTPFSNGVATIGARVSTPSYDALDAIGYYQQTRNTSGSNQQVGFDITSFQAVGEPVPEPKTVTLLLAGVALWAARYFKRRRRLS